MPSRKYRWETRITHEVNKKPVRATHKMITKEKRRDPWGRPVEEEDEEENGDSTRWKHGVRLHEILGGVKAEIAAKTSEEARKRQAALLKPKSEDAAARRNKGGKSTPTALKRRVAKCETHLGSNQRVEYALPVDAPAARSSGASQAAFKSRKSDVSDRKERGEEEENGDGGGDGGVRGSGVARTSSERGRAAVASHPPGTVLKLTPKYSAVENQQRKMHNLRKGRPAEEKLLLPIDEQRHFSAAPTRRRVAVGERKFDDLPDPLRRHIETSLLDKSSEASLMRRREEEEAMEEEERRRRENQRPPDKATIDRLATPKYRAKRHEHEV